MDSLSVKKIYLAGPDVFRPASIDYFSNISSTLRRHGCVAVSPMDSEAVSASLIYKNNISLIQSCDWLMANLDPFRGVSADAGTAFEMGYADALGLRIVGYYTNGIPDEYKYRVKKKDRKSKYRKVEDFGLTDNLMLINACEYVGNSIYDAIHYIYTQVKM